VIFDAAVFATVQDIIPAERLSVHLVSLVGQMAAMGRASAANGANLRDQAHKIISQAGMLGLMRLSRRARVLEDACIAGEGTVEALRECCAAADDIRRYAIPAAAGTEVYKHASR
jgi:HPt (histidine-containing phosphotransfer) domain-containing protein